MSMASPDGRVAAALVRRHPLQRLDSPSRSLSAALHLAGLASFASSWKYLVDNPNDINASYGWHFQYLTNIGLFLATVTFAAGFLADLFNSSRLFYLKNLLGVCSAPLEILITALYWSLSAIDKRLVLPDFVEETTIQVDFGFHLVPAFVLAIDLLFFSPPWTIGALPAMGVSALLSVGYWMWVEACYANNGFYPYPIFEAGGTLWRAGLFAGSAATMTVNTLILKWAYSRVNGATGRRVKPGDKY